VVVVVVRSKVVEPPLGITMVDSPLLMFRVMVVAAWVELYDIRYKLVSRRMAINAIPPPPVGGCGENYI
jgi:hypothetical protein